MALTEWVVSNPEIVTGSVLGSWLLSMLRRTPAAMDAFIDAMRAWTALARRGGRALTLWEGKMRQDAGSAANAYDSDEMRVMVGLHDGMSDDELLAEFRNGDPTETLPERLQANAQRLLKLARAARDKDAPRPRKRESSWPWSRGGRHVQ